MSLRDDLRGVLDKVRAIPDTALGLRVTTVTVRLEKWDRAIQDGAVVDIAGHSDTVLSPTPQVKKLSATQASFYGGGPLAASVGKPLVHVYRIGPLTQRYTSNAVTGGYLLTDLLKVPANGTTQRAVYCSPGPSSTPAASCTRSWSTTPRIRSRSTSS
jgi:hypothetical protein